MVIALLVFLTIVFGISSYLWLTKTDTLSVSLSLEHPVLLNAPLQLVPTTTLEREALFKLISQNYQESQFDVLQLLLVTDASGSIHIPTDQVLGALELSPNIALSQAITHIYFGGIKKTEAFVLLKITDTNTARGGLLAWETTLYNELSPLFLTGQTPVSEDTQTAVFVDEVVAGADVRSLKTLAGRELMIYGITNRDTVIIATNRSAFENLTALTQ